MNDPYETLTGKIRIESLPSLMEPSAPALTEVQRLAVQHPAWPAWVAVSTALRAACDDDFGRFCDVRDRELSLKERQGQLSITERLELPAGRELSRRIRQALRDQEREHREAAIKAAPTTEPERWQQAMKWAKGKPEYAALFRGQ